MIKRKGLLTNRALGDRGLEILSRDNDWFGTFPKAQFIKAVLEEFNQSFKNNNMFALYGPWGSGKSTVMKYLQHSLVGYKSVFFEAWKLEGKEDLRVSLLDCILDELSVRDLAEEVRECKKLFLEIIKSSNVNIGVLSFNVERAVEKAESTRVINEKSSYRLLEEFSDKFKRLEEKYIEKTRKTGIIIFIDDLDRCSPEGVMSLISGIKLFFTYGKCTTYFLGIDKKAVSNIISNNYNGHMNPDDYLEKIFDVSFSMPDIKDLSTKKYVSHLFQEDFFVDESDRQDFIDKVCVFFDALNFKNPRKVKKLINNYYLLEYFVSTLQPNAKGYELKSILNIDDQLNQGNAFNIAIVFYLLILNTFHRDYLKQLIDVNRRFISYKNHLTTLKGSLIGDEYIDNLFLTKDRFNRNLKTSDFFMGPYTLKNKSFYPISGLILLFLPEVKDNIIFRFTDANKIEESKGNLIHDCFAFFESKEDIRYRFISFIINEVAFTAVESGNSVITVKKNSSFISSVGNYDKQSRRVMLNENLINVMNVAEFMFEYL